MAGLAGGLVFGCGERPGEREYQSALRQLERDRLIRARDLFEKSINKRPGHETNALVDPCTRFVRKINQQTPWS